MNERQHWIGWAVGVAAVAVGVGCASGNDSPAATDTEVGTDTLSTSSSSSTTSTSDDSDDSDEVSSTTNDSSDSTSSTTEAQTGSTGCADGEEGCPCRADEPACDTDLDCVADVCSAGLCDSEDDEPNDDPPGEAVELGMFDDNAPPMEVMSQLNGPDDVDWFTYSCTDTLVPVLDPELVIEQDTQMRVCIFLDCETGGNPLMDCVNGSTEEMAPFGFLPGCCVTDGATIDVSDYNCPDTSVDSITAYLRVDMGDTLQCEPYSLTYNC